MPSYPNVLAALLLCAGGLLGVALADDPAAPTVVPTKPSSGVVLLTNGRLVEGRLSQTAGGYAVDKPEGTLVIPFENIRLTARNRGEAFRKLRITMPNNSVETSLALARWCLSYRLYSECRAELRAALAQQPDHEEARTMLKRVEEILNPAQAEHLLETTAPERTGEGFLKRDAASLAGLSPETARSYVIHIQPMLMNTCANASCHGPAAKNDFRLTRVGRGRGNHRIFAERNLAALLIFIDLDDPRASPLLEKPKGNHGRGGRAVFHGPRGADQQKRLRDWVLRVARERAGTSPRQQTAKVSPVRQETTAEIKQVSAQQDATLSAPSSIQPAKASPRKLEQTLKQTNSADLKLIQRILKEERRDAFDPEEFNRTNADQNP